LEELRIPKCTFENWKLTDLYLSIVGKSWSMQLKNGPLGGSREGEKLKIEATQK
jgi:hypothetical protein